MRVWRPVAGTLRFDHGSAVCGQEGGLSVHVVTMTFTSELPGLPPRRSRWRRALVGEQRLADEPRSSESFAYGSPDLQRLRADRYRVFYTIEEEQRVIQIDHVARLP